MKYLAQKVFAGLGQLIALSILTCAVPAFAQFEVSPDHFDPGPAVEKKQATKTSLRKTGSASRAKAAKSNQDNTHLAVAANHSQASGAAAGKSQNDGKASATTNTAAAKPKKRVPANRVVLASTQ